MAIHFGTPDVARHASDDQSGHADSSGHLESGERQEGGEEEMILMKSYRFILAPMAACALSLITTPVAYSEPSQNGGLTSLMHSTKAKVDAFLGKPYDSRPSKAENHSTFFSYNKGGNKYLVEIEGGKVIAINVTLSSGKPSPAQALKAVGIPVPAKKPDESSAEETVWHGNLSPSGIRHIHVGNVGNGWALIELSDEQDG